MSLVIFDLDGTLVESHLMDYGGKLGPRQDRAFTEPVLLPGRFAKIEHHANVGDRFAICTNQGGVAWGYCNVTEAKIRVARAIAELGFFFGAPLSVHIAFEHPRATVPAFKADGRRKPAPTMLEEAIEAHFTREQMAWPLEKGDHPIAFVGDRSEDEQAAENAGVDFVHADEFFRA